MCYNLVTLWAAGDSCLNNRRDLRMIQFNNVVKSYQQGNKALAGVSMQIEDGEFCFLPLRFR